MDKIDRIKEIINNTELINKNGYINETSRRQKTVQSIFGRNKSVLTFAIITSENPMGDELTPKENKDLYTKLCNDLYTQQYKYFPIKGVYGNTEHSLIIFNISLNDTKRFGNLYNQESFIFANVNYENEDEKVTFRYFQKGEKQFSQYKEIESINKFIDVTDQTDFFTAIGRNFKFTIPFERLNEEITKYDNMIQERADKYDEYKRIFHTYLYESVSDNKTAKHHRMRRSLINGKNYELYFKK